MPTAGGSAVGRASGAVSRPREALNAGNTAKAAARGGNPTRPASDLIDRLRRFDLFSHLPARAMAGIAAATRVLESPPGTWLWRRGDPCLQALFIEGGLAITSRRVREDVDRTYGLYGPGDSLGIHAIWAGMRYPTDAQVLNHPLTALCLDTSALLRCAEREPELAGPLRVEIGHFTDAFIRKIDVVSAGAVQHRLATLLAALIERHGVATGDNAACLPYKLTLAQIGGIADARIETVARVFSQWKKQGWLEVDAHGFHLLELDRLYALTGAHA